MAKVIKTINGNFYFEQVHLYHGRKTLDKRISGENLLTVKDILGQSTLSWGLIYGTLLGALREKDFIEHDEDTDIYIFNEDREKLLELLPQLYEAGFKVARYDRSLMSVIRGDEYIDFYFFKEVSRGRRSGGYFVPSKFFTTQSTILFLGAEFPTVHKPAEFLSYTYGDDWEVPKINCHAASSPSVWQIVLSIVPPIFYKLYRCWKGNGN